MRLFKVTACIPSPEKVRSQRELQNTFFTKWVPYESWFADCLLYTSDAADE